MRRPRLALPAALASERRRRAHASRMPARSAMRTSCSSPSMRCAPIGSPVLDASLAARGVRFMRAYAAAPSTAPSITSLMTAHAAALRRSAATLAEGCARARLEHRRLLPGRPLLRRRRRARAATPSRTSASVGPTRARNRPTPLTDAALERRLAASHGEPRSFFWLHYFRYARALVPRGMPADAAPGGAPSIARSRASSTGCASSRVRRCCVSPPITAKSSASTAAPITARRSTTSSCAFRFGRRLLGGEPAASTTPFSLVDLAPALSSLLEAARALRRGDVHAALDSQPHDRARSLEAHPRHAPRRRRALRSRRPIRASSTTSPASRATSPRRSPPRSRAGCAPDARRARRRWSIARAGADRAAAARELGAREAVAARRALAAALADERQRARRSRARAGPAHRSRAPRRFARAPATSFPIAPPLAARDLCRRPAPRALCPPARRDAVATPRCAATPRTTSASSATPPPSRAVRRRRRSARARQRLPGAVGRIAARKKRRPPPPCAPASAEDPSPTRAPTWPGAHPRGTRPK